MTDAISLAFYDQHADRAWGRAKQYGKRVATMPDIVEARLAAMDSWTKAPVWNNYVTTTSAEYAGISKNGARILIVAHGIGPLSTPTDLKRCRVQDDDRQGRGGVSKEEFRKLESGVYGPVEIVDLEALVKPYQYPFIAPFSGYMARKDALFKARVGPRWEEYLNALIRVDDEYEQMPEARVRKGEPWAPPPIVQLQGPSNSSYFINGLDREPHRYFDDYIPWTKEGALAHLIVVGQVTAMHMSEYRRRAVLISEIGLHEASNGSRFVGMPEGKNADFRTVNGNRILNKHWRDLLVEAEGALVRLRHLIQLDDGSYFTDRIKTGECMDHCVAEHPVRSMVKVPGPKMFTTTIGGYYGFLKYGLKEVEAIAPAEANAYELGGVAIRHGQDAGDPGHHDCAITFYRADIDLKHRVMTGPEIEADADLVVKMTR